MFEVRTAVPNPYNAPTGVPKLMPRLVGPAEHSRNKFNFSLLCRTQLSQIIINTNILILHYILTLNIKNKSNIKKLDTTRITKNKYLYGYSFRIGQEVTNRYFTLFANV